MTGKQLRYDENCKRSKKLCAEMERLVAVCNYDQLHLRNESYYNHIMELIYLRKELEKIWDEQLRLFDPKTLTKTQIFSKQGS